MNFHRKPNNAKTLSVLARVAAILLYSRLAIVSFAEEMTSNLQVGSDLYSLYKENGIIREGSNLKETDNEKIMDNDEKILIPHEYFPRYRLRNQDPIPFIFLVPSFSYWNSVGQKLGSRGYSVMICATCEDEDGPDLVKSIFEDRRWKRAVLLGCDKESLLAFRAAAELGPEQVAGLILCGDLRTVEAEMETDEKNFRSLIHSHIECPFHIIGGRSVSSSDKDDEGRGSDYDESFSHFRGGSLAPYRRRLPGHFACELTRFLEESIIPPKDSTIREIRYRKNFWSELYRAGLPEIVGRCSAYLIICWGIAKVSSYQKESISDTGIRIKSGYLDIKKQVLTFFGKSIAIRILGIFKKKDDEEQQELQLIEDDRTEETDNELSDETARDKSLPHFQKSLHSQSLSIDVARLSDSIELEGRGINL